MRGLHKKYKSITFESIVRSKSTVIAMSACSSLHFSAKILKRTLSLLSSSVKSDLKTLFQYFPIVSGQRFSLMLHLWLLVSLTLPLFRYSLTQQLWTANHCDIAVSSYGDNMVVHRLDQCCHVWGQMLLEYYRFPFAIQNGTVRYPKEEGHWPVSHDVCKTLQPEIRVHVLYNF